MNKFENKLNSPFNQFMFFLYKIILINLLFLFTTALGLVVFTITPAIIASMTCIKAVIEKKDFPIVRSFWYIFKKEYKKSMLFLLYYIVVFGILGLSFDYYLNAPDTMFHTFGLLVSGLLLVINFGSFIHFILISIYTPDIKFKSKIKYSYLMLIYSPFTTLMLLVVNIALVVFAYIFITFSFLFTFAFIAYYNLAITTTTYRKISNDHVPLNVLSH